MKAISSSILILSAVLLLISAEHFHSLLFGVIGIVMLIDGSILFLAFMLFPERFSTWLKNINSRSIKHHSISTQA